MGKRTDIEATLRSAARQQLGLLTRAQLAELGVSTSLLKARIRRGEWSKVVPKVFAIEPCGSPWEQRCMAATLSTGGVIVGPSAARLFEVDGFVGEDLSNEIHVAGEVDRRHGSYRLHLGDPVPKEFRTKRKNIPVCAPHWLLLTLGKAATRNEVEVACDFFVRRNMVRWKELEALVRAQLRRGRHSVCVLRDVLDLRGPQFKTTDSPLETWLLQLIRDCGWLPIPELQFEVMRNGVHVATADLAYPKQKVLLEAQGYLAHGAKWQLTRDCRRMNRLTGLEDYRVLAFTKKQIQKEPLETLRAIATALGIPWQMPWVLQRRPGGRDLLRVDSTLSP